jgi:hypothetical protein
LPVGSQLQGGKYVAEAVLGEGSFSITYRAANTGLRLHQQVAIQELFVEGSRWPTKKGRGDEKAKWSASTQCSFAGNE